MFSRLRSKTNSEHSFRKKFSESSIHFANSFILQKNLRFFCKMNEHLKNRLAPLLTNETTTEPTLRIHFAEILKIGSLLNRSFCLVD